MWPRICKKVAKTVFDIIVSLGMFTAMVAFHLISFVAFLLFSTAVIIGISLVYFYFVGTKPPVPIQNCLILSILTFMSKYQLLFYYKLIYPGDNYEKHCWSFITKVMKLIYALVGSHAFIQIMELHWNHNLYLDGDGDGDSLSMSNITNDPNNNIHHHHLVSELSEMSSDFRLKSIIVSLLWDNENRSFLVSMAILVHLFHMFLYRDYSLLCKYVPIFRIKCLIALSYAVTIQTLYFAMCFLEFYVVHAWVPYHWIKANFLLYVVLIMISLLIWILQLTLFELITEKLCNIVQKDHDPFYWLQNMARGRILGLNSIFLPLLINVFYTNEDYCILLNNFLGWKGTIIPINNHNHSLFFFAFFCSTIVHSLKTQMLLKNGLARIVYTGWICYFQLYDWTMCYCCYCCCCCCDYEYDSDDEDLSEITSGDTTTGTLSEITTWDDRSKSRSSLDRSKKGHGRKRKAGPSKAGRNVMMSSFGDQAMQGQGLSEDDVRKIHAHASVNKSAGVGDSQWIPEKIEEH